MVRKNNFKWGLFIVVICSLFIACTKVEINYNVEGKLQSKIMYKGGKKNGPAVFYYNNGKKSLEANYKNDELDGKLVRYYSTGDIETEETYKNGLLDGVSVSYNEIIAIVLKVNTKKVSGMVYFSNSIRKVLYILMVLTKTIK